MKQYCITYLEIGAFILRMCLTFCNIGAR